MGPLTSVNPYHRLLEMYIVCTYTTILVNTFSEVELNAARDVGEG